MFNQLRERKKDKRVCYYVTARYSSRMLWVLTNLTPFASGDGQNSTALL